jgi:tRNA(fMet)-specific endonuclease VapC
LNYLLDTNAVIALLTNRPPAVRDRLRRVLARRANSIAISSIVLYELWYGVARSERRRENAERLRVFLSGNIGIADFTEEDAIAAGELRAALERVGAPIGPYDLLIAGQALRGQSTLVTANVSEFMRVRGLRGQDWSLGASRASC